MDTRELLRNEGPSLEPRRVLKLADGLLDLVGYLAHLMDERLEELKGDNTAEMAVLRGKRAGARHSAQFHA